MTHGRRGSLARFIRQILQPAGAGNVTDSELLGRFLGGRDEAAFELLLWRHGGLVLKVCRDLLASEQDIEDAFQATFLVLVRKARSIHKREALGGWLYQVATRIAWKLRAQQARRGGHERQGLDLSAIPSAAEVPDSELRPLLHEEIVRLPAKYREPILLCYFEGKTHEEAARLLGWPKGTVAGRLARARQLLGRRLQRRGVQTTGATVAAILAPEALAIPPAALVKATLQIVGPASLSAVSARVLSLTEGVLRAMFLSKLKIAGAVVLILGLAGAGAGALLRTSQAALAEGRPETATEAAGGEAAPDDAVEVEKDLSEEAEQHAARQTRENLKRIALAMHNYEGTYGHFPASAIYSKNGKPLLSWRVALLPYLEQDSLYKQFKLDEPWDSPHNKRLLARMPAVYRIPAAQPKDATSTYYQVIVGNGAAFEEPRWGDPFSGAGGMMGGMFGGEGAGSGAPPGAPGSGFAPPGDTGAPGGIGPPMGGGAPPGGLGAPGGAGGSMGPAGGMMPLGVGGPTHVRGLSIAHFTDGTSNTLLVVEAETPVPWTKPEDLPYSPIGRLPRLGGPFRQVFHAAFADGSVHAVDKKLEEQLLRAAITRSGGEVLDLYEVVDPVTNTDIKELREENRRLEQEIADLEGELQRLRSRQRREKIRSSGTEAPTIVEQLQREQKALRREMERLQNQTEKLRRELEQIRGEVGGSRGK